MTFLTDTTEAEVHRISKIDSSRTHLKGISVSYFSQTSRLIIALGFLPFCVNAATVGPVSVDLKITVDGIGDLAPVVPDPVSKTQPVGTGEDPLPLSSSLDYYTNHFGGYNYAGYGNAEIFYDSPEKFGASVGFDNVEANCSSECSIEAEGLVEFSFKKTDASQEKIPFTISAADLFVSNHEGTYADYYVNIYVTNDGSDVDDGDFLKNASLYEVFPLGDFVFSTDDGYFGFPDMTGVLNKDATIAATLRSAATGYPYTREGASFITDTYSNFLDITSFDVGATIDLSYNWAVSVATESSSASAYAKFQDPLGPVNLDLSAFDIVGSDPTVPSVSAVPLPAGFYLMLTGLMSLLLGSRWRGAFENRHP